MLHLCCPIKALAKFGAYALRSELFGNGALEKLAICRAVHCEDLPEFVKQLSIPIKTAQGPRLDGKTRLHASAPDAT